MIAGLVLAAGRSTRFGSEKAIAPLGDRTLMEWALAALRPHCGPIAVSARPGSGAAELAARLDLPVIVDGANAPDGPLSGIAAGLRWASSQGAEYLATLPCDMPHAPADLIPRLTAARGEAFAAFAVTPDGPHPLCALWSIDLLVSLEAALARGHPAVRAFLADIGAVEVMFEDEAAFANLNRPADS
ncbi:MAG: molybdenum cofactor guanylyltransferase [Caulobacter sp.]|nr:molybdenum cofactor guanylyltransferase [Caulobacter sp.]